MEDVMKTIIPKLGFSLLIGSSLLTSSLFAQSASSGGSLWDCCSGCWEVGGAALWQQTCVQNFIFADDQTRGVGITTKHNLIDVKPRFSWGFKIWGGWYSCDNCNFASLTWKHLWSHKDSRTYTAKATLILSNVGGTVSSSVFGRQATAYDTAYLSLGRTLYCGCDSRFYSYGSIRYVRGEIRRYAKDNLGDFFKDRSKFQGGGLEVGIGGEYSLGCKLSLVGQLGGMILLGRRTHYFARGIVEGGVNLVTNSITIKSITKCVPAIDARLGINYTYDWCACGCNLRLVGEIGWEMDYYWNMLALYPYASSTHLDPTNFGTNGPYASLVLRF
jgi:hypothetical protein